MIQNNALRRAWYALEVFFVRFLGIRNTATILTILLTLLTIGTIEAEADRFPFKSLLMILSTSGVFVGWGSLLIKQKDSFYLRWIGFVLFLYGVVAALNAGWAASDRASDPLNWLLISRGVWGWSLVIVLGARFAWGITDEVMGATDELSRLRREGQEFDIIIKPRR